MPNPTEIATIVVNGVVYSQWTSVRVTIPAGKEVFSSFDFVACEGDSTIDLKKMPAGTIASLGLSKIKVGDACQVYLAGIKTVDGYIVIRDASLGPGDHTVILQGASKVMDIVHGAPMPKEYKNYGIGPIINSMLEGFQGISFVPPNGADIDKPLQTFRTQFGETVWEAAERLGRMRGLIYKDDADGNLVGVQLKSAGSAPSGTLLAEGENIIQIRAVLDDQSVMSKVAAVVQQQGSDGNRAGAVSKNSAVATNPGARQGRDVYILGEHPGDADDAKIRADHELARQFYTSVDVNCVVQGWFKPGGGDLWQTIENVPVYSPSCFTTDDGLMPDLFVRQTTFLQDSYGGTKTSIDLCLKTGLTNLPDAGDSAGGPPNSGQQGGAQPSYDSLGT